MIFRLTSDLMDHTSSSLNGARLRSVQEHVWAVKPYDVRFQLMIKNRDWCDKRLPACSENLAVQTLANGLVNVVQVSSKCPPVVKTCFGSRRVLVEAEKFHTFNAEHIRCMLFAAYVLLLRVNVPTTISEVLKREHEIAVARDAYFSDIESNTRTHYTAEVLRTKSE